jgi:hypothetical protein
MVINFRNYVFSEISFEDYDLPVGTTHITNSYSIATNNKKKSKKSLVLNLSIG